MGRLRKHFVQEHNCDLVLEWRFHYIELDYEKFQSEQSVILRLFGRQEYEKDLKLNS